MWLLLLNVFDEGKEQGKSRRAGGICTFAEAKLTWASHRAGSMNRNVTMAILLPMAIVGCFTPPSSSIANSPFILPHIEPGAKSETRNCEPVKDASSTPVSG